MPAMVNPRSPILTVLGVALATIGLAPPPAMAHFVLRAPTSWRDQNVLGDPQKLGPCGDEGAAAATGAVTAFAPGETITITIDEVIFHPGHYRVALAVNDPSELPPEPVVTPGATDCGSVPIMDPVVFPVLVDGALLHAQPFSGTQALQVTLPSDVTCSRCTLQVLEFMSNHAAPCFYHHCAHISIGASSTACESDTACDDADACTIDVCNPTTGMCEHSDTGASCDDGDPCTADTCSPIAGCIAAPLTLAAVDPTFLGTLEVASCTEDRVPGVIGKLFARAGNLVGRAAKHPTKARRFLRRAEQQLRKTRKKVTRAPRRRISTGCSTALGAAVDDARTRLRCLPR